MLSLASPVIALQEGQIGEGKEERNIQVVGPVSDSPRSRLAATAPNSRPNRWVGGVVFLTFDYAPDV